MKSVYNFLNLLFLPTVLCKFACFPAFLTPHSTQRLRFGGSLADIVRFTNLLTYLLKLYQEQ